MIAKLVLRYSFSRSNRHRWQSLKIAISYALSLSALMIVLSLMASLQNARFDVLRDVKSFDITVSGADEDEIKALYPLCSVFSYYEGYAMLDGKAMIIRYVDENYDGGLNYLYGDNSSLMASYALYLSSSNTIRFSKLNSTSSRRNIINEDIPLSGVFYSNLGEFDSNYALMSKERATSDDRFYVAIKGSDDISPLVENGIVGYETWKEKESTLYSAFTLENFMMSLVLLVLLVIVFVEIRQEARVFINNKMLERIELLIVGLERWKASLVFIFSFLIILALGSLLSIAITLAGIEFFSTMLRRYYHYYRPIELDLALFLFINIVFYIISSLAILSYLNKADKKSIREAIYG